MMIWSLPAKPAVGNRVTLLGSLVLVLLASRTSTAEEKLRGFFPHAAAHTLAGKLDPESWYANFAESGGRVLGEACHFLDYFCFLFETRPLRVWAQTIWPGWNRGVAGSRRGCGWKAATECPAG